MFNMITGNEMKTLTKYISWECKCRFDGTKFNSNRWWNNYKCWYEFKKHNIYEKGYIWNPATCDCGNGKCLASTMDDSVIRCDEVIESYNEEIKTIPTNFNEKNIICKAQNFDILLAFLLITIVLLVAVSIYCHLIQHQGKPKHLLPFSRHKMKTNLYWK